MVIHTGALAYHTDIRTTILHGILHGTLHYIHIHTGEVPGMDI